VSDGYSLAHVAAPKIAEHLAQHRRNQAAEERSPELLLPDSATIETLLDAAFWASLRREEGYVPKISLAYLPATPDVHPMLFAASLTLDSARLAKLGPAVERPGIHLGVWDGRVWGTTRHIPPFCLVVEVLAPGLLVVKHRPRVESPKFVNVAVIEADRVKIVDEGASAIVDCPALLTSLLGFETPGESRTNTLIQIAVSMRRHGRGGALIVVPAGTDTWQQSIVQPISYAVNPAFSDPDWASDRVRAVDALAGLTAVDGATIITDRYELLAFGAKIRRKTGGESVEQLIVTEPIEGSVTERLHPVQLGGTRHLSAAQFVKDQHDALALVASQDGHFTIFAWSPCEETVHAHRIEALLL
jgi:hypothetical protein